MPNLEEALAIEPGLPETRLLAAQSALAADQPGRADIHLQTLPASEGLHCLWLELAIREGDLSSALTSLGDPKTSACASQILSLQLIAHELFANGTYESAEPILERLAESRHATAKVYGQLGLIWAVQEPERALSYLSLAAEADPGTSGVLIDAIEQAREAGNAAYVLARVGQALARQGEWTLAATAFENALALEPAYTEARAYYGLALDRSGGNGLEHLERAAHEAPEAALPLSLIGKHWRARSDAGRAIDYFERAAALAPEDPVLVIDLGAAYAAAGDLPAAKLAFQRATELAPNDPLYWTMLAQFSLDYEIELSEVALPAARRAALLRPRDGQALDLLGYTYFRVGNWTLADRFLNEALLADRDSASAHYHLGLLELASGETTLARQSLATALALDPDGRVGALALRSMENLQQ